MNQDTKPRKVITFHSRGLIMRWTKDEEKALRKVYRNNSNTEVANIIGRSRSAVQKKASQLGITKTKRYMNSLRKNNATNR